jgi:hypothetical protein
VDHDQVLPALREKWDAEGEAEVLAAFAHDGAAPEAVNAVMAWYTGVFNGAVGDTANLNAAELETEFRTLAKKAGISQRLTDGLVEWQKARLA